jgi:hypothetical protein
MCVAGSCESISMFLDWVLLSATRLAAMVFELACSACAAPPTVAERHVPEGPGPAVLSKRFG